MAVPGGKASHVGRRQHRDQDDRPGGSSDTIALRSPAFGDGGFIPARYGKDGDDVPPPVEWSGIPKGTAELALLVDDPDARRGTFLHWLVTGIDPASSGLRASVPPGTTAWRNDFGEVGYGGPRPPAGDAPHHYRFRLYALPAPLGLGPGTNIDEVRRALEERSTATGTLVGLFAR